MMELETTRSGRDANGHLTDCLHVIHDESVAQISQ